MPSQLSGASQAPVAGRQTVLMSRLKSGPHSLATPSQASGASHSPAAARQMKPEGWQPGTVDAIATTSADGRRIVIKAVNYSGSSNTLLVHLQGSRVPAGATATVYTIAAGLHDAASLEQPDRITPVERSIEFRPDLTIDLKPYAVAVVEIATR